MIQIYYPIKELPEPFQSMATGGGKYPFNPIITQGFGENAVPFYKQLGLRGHNGVDYVAPKRTKIFAAHDGIITKTYDVDNSSRTIGFGIWLTHSEGWQTVYFHLDEVVAKLKSVVKAGDLIGYSDNTGEYTTGDHLHFGLYPANLDKNNGYGGAIDPTEYFINLNQNTMLKTYQPKDDNRVYAEIDGFYYWITSDRMYAAGLNKIFEPFIVVDKIEPTKIIGTFNKEY